MRRLIPAVGFLILVSGVLGACNLDPGKQPWDPPSAAAQPATPVSRIACAQHIPLRRPLFGDLHVHTGLSMDARVRDTISTPDDAYRFARGEAIGFPPLAPDGSQTRKASIDRPLDFAAVTDHAEWLAESMLCTTPGSEVYDTDSCRVFRGQADTLISRILGLEGFRKNLTGVISLFGRNEEVCGEGLGICRAASRSAWLEIQDAAERWYDRSEACTFTAFHGFEYSRSPKFTKIHRNVIFKNEIVPELPISWIDTPEEPEFWRKLRQQCNDSGSGCDAVAIPHNPNLSNGQLFSVWYRDLPEEEQREAAKLRAGLEPIVEIVQQKGDSECRNGLYGVVGEPDELCDFEKIRDMGGYESEDCEEGAGWGAQKGSGCISRLDYARYALVEGIREQERIGLNPYKFGFIGSTDTHLANPGGVAEKNWIGSYGASVSKMLEVGEQKSPQLFRSAGGLAGVWAEENSRGSIFAGLQRREAFATSGTRIAPRFFGGWELPKDLCERTDLVETGYRDGVAMGSDLPPVPAGAGAPRFAVNALRDPEGAPLQRLQIVKAWLGADGLFHQSVQDVAGDAANGASVDLATCEPRGTGADSLCAVWEDPDFDPAMAAVYYARVIENPSCRWSTWHCLAIPEAERPDGCSDARVPKTIQERAYTSPIWFEPKGG
ncbi:MAG: DUF3604 domain-containing protein [bacterium]|nr:DUF3604 domain-containing protein [bacterium]